MAALPQLSASHSLSSSSTTTSPASLASFATATELSPPSPAAAPPAPSSAHSHTHTLPSTAAAAAAAAAAATPTLPSHLSPTPRSSISLSDRSPERPLAAALRHQTPSPLAGLGSGSGPASAPAPAKNQRSPSGIFSFAAAALDRTQTAIANFSDPVIRHRRSNTALSRLSLIGSPFPSPGSDPAGTSGERRTPTSVPSLHHQRSPSPSFTLELKQPLLGPSIADPPSQPYSETDATRPPPIRLPLPNQDNKMHQTSSRLLRMTDDDRPFTKDFKDLFSTLIVSLLPLTPHRVRLTKVDHTFLSEDAINNLGSLKFSQSNRMPDPKDPSRIVTTTTTTTFSMAKDMARSICQRFVEARFIESADGKYQQIYNMKGSVWQLTPKGISVLDRFCSKNGIQQKQVAELANLHASQLVVLERDQTTDKLLNDRGTIEVIFRRFVGATGRNLKSSVNAADSDSLHDYKDGLTGVKMAAERKINGKTLRDTFTGKAATDWLMDCSTIVDRRETNEVATLFVDYDLMEPINPDRAYMSQNQGSTIFQPTKHAIYQITQRGKDLINGTSSRGRASESEGGTNPTRNGGVARDSHTQRLDKILNDPALRLLFRENLRDTHCEENLSFYQDVDEFVRSCKAATRAAQKNPSSTSMDGIREIMAQAYSIYNAFLAPGSPCELNIDHQLRNNLATRMTKAVGQDVAMIETLQEVTSLFEDAQNAVFKLMASDSVPKFLRNAKYENQLRNYEFELNGRGPERSLSRSNRK